MLSIFDFYYNQIAWMKFKTPCETTKAKLIDYHKDTYPHRHAWIMKSTPSGTEILTEYPRFLDCDTGALVSFCSYKFTDYKLDLSKRLE